MKALVFCAPGVVEVQDVDEVQAKEGEVIVHVERAGICGSELHGITKPSFRVPPFIMGHEFVGRTRRRASRGGQSAHLVWHVRTVSSRSATALSKPRSAWGSRGGRICRACGCPDWPHSTICRTLWIGTARRSSNLSPTRCTRGTLRVHRRVNVSASLDAVRLDSRVSKSPAITERRPLSAPTSPPIGKRSRHGWERRGSGCPWTASST